MALPNNPTPSEVVKAIRDLENSGGSSTDVQVDNNSQVVGGVANLKTKNGDYNASTNKLVTEDDILEEETFVSTADVSPLSNYFTKSEAASIDLRNVTAIRSSQPVYVNNIYGLRYSGKHLCIESWRSSDRTSGYRLYDDGYCEQWGFVYPKTSSTVTVSLFKTYYDANYNVTLAAHWTGNHSDNVNNSNKTASSFQLVSGSASSGFGVYWKACGYIN